MPASMTQLNPFFTLILHAFLRFGTVPCKPALKTAPHELLASASAVASDSPPPTPRARVHDTVPGPRSSARALLAG
eukprot:5169076-Pleurochrysis_carterae.AAC.1